MFVSCLKLSLTTGSCNPLVYGCPQMFLTCWSFSGLFMKERSFLSLHLTIQLQSKSSGRTSGQSKAGVKLPLQRMCGVASKGSFYDEQSRTSIRSSLRLNSWCLFAPRLLPSLPSSTSHTPPVQESIKRWKYAFRDVIKRHYNFRSLGSLFIQRNTSTCSLLTH